MTYQHMVTLILILSTYIPKENYFCYELQFSCWAFRSASLLSGAVTQESQTFLTVTLMCLNYWGNLLYELTLGITSRPEIFAQLLSFQKSEGISFLSGRSKCMGIFSLHASCFNTEFKLAARKLRDSESGNVYRYLTVGGLY